MPPSCTFKYWVTKIRHYLSVPINVWMGIVYHSPKWMYLMIYLRVYTPHVYTFVVYPYMRGWPVAFSSSKSSCISSTTVTAYHSLEETFWSLWKRHLPADEKSGISSVKEVYNNVLGKWIFTNLKLAAFNSLNPSESKKAPSPMIPGESWVPLKLSRFRSRPWQSELGNGTCHFLDDCPRKILDFPLPCLIPTGSEYG